MAFRNIRSMCKALAGIAGGAFMVVIFIVAGAGIAAASIGVGGATPAYLKFPDFEGSWQGDTHKNWIKTNGRLWVNIMPQYTTTLGVGDPLFAAMPGPKPGSPNKLAVAIDKKSADLPKLAKLCADKTTIPEVTFDEPVGRLRPAGFPDFWEYKLKNVQLIDCDMVVPGASDQAFVLSFQDIEWVNYDPNAPRVVPMKSTAAEIPNLQPAPNSAKKKDFLITWFGMATLGEEGSCPVMDSSSTEDEFYALLPKDQADAIRAKQGEKPVSYGGPDRGRPTMEERGPYMLSIGPMPGIVPDPGHPEPQTTKAMGVNLDGNDGTGPAPAGTCKHENFVSMDGSLQGVDNQLFRVYGCIPGYRGKEGYMNQTHNARRADGNVVTLIEISGINDPMNDKDVDISIFYAKDKPVRSASGQFIPNYTFRMSDDPNFARYNQRIHGSIVNGYVVSPSIKLWKFNNGQGGIVELNNAQFRLHIEPDGNLKGVVGGYTDWRGLANGGSYGEQLFRFKEPGIYNSLKRNADGMKDPVTGECNGISEAYEIDGVPAFITPDAPKASKVSQASTTTQQAAAG